MSSQIKAGNAKVCNREWGECILKYYGECAKGCIYYMALPKTNSNKSNTGAKTGQEGRNDLSAKTKGEP